MTDSTAKVTSVGPAIRTRRWWVIDTVVLALIGVGLMTLNPGLLALAAIGIVFGTYTTAAIGGEGRELDIERTVRPKDPAPGQTLEVELTIQNTGSKPLPDIRFVDGVPGALKVAEGSPRFATALRSGDEHAHSYGITAVRGEHAFDPATVALRSLGGALERTITLENKTTITCSPPLSEVPLRSQTSIFTGRVSTDVGGTGLEFHSVREYRSGDPLKRIDWRRYAKTSELTTVDFREQRAATVMLLIDNRPAAYWTASQGDRHAVEHAIAAAGQVFAALISNGDRVGITTLDDGDVWFSPSAGQAALVEAQHLLATHPALRYDPPETVPELAIHPEHSSVEALPVLARLPDDAQIIVFTPLCDDGIVPTLKHFEASGHATTVVSQDVIRGDTTGRRLARTQRTNRLGMLRDAGIRVLDWDPSMSLPEVLIAAERRGESV